MPGTPLTGMMKLQRDLAPFPVIADRGLTATPQNHDVFTTPETFTFGPASDIDPVIGSEKVQR